MLDRRIRLRHLQVFVEIVRQGSLKRAAEVLFLTQPAISRTMAELEEIVGDRLARGILAGQGLAPTLRHHGANEGLFTALAAGQEDVAAASGSQEPGEEVGGEPVIGIGEADPLSPGPLHPEVSGASLSAVVRLDDLDVEVGSPRPAPAGPR